MCSWSSRDGGTVWDGGEGKAVNEVNFDPGSSGQAGVLADVAAPSPASEAQPYNSITDSRHSLNAQNNPGYDKVQHANDAAVSPSENSTALECTLWCAAFNEHG